MALTERQAVGLLIRAGLLDIEAVVGGDLRIRNLSRRNSNFAVLRACGPSLLLKQGPGPTRAMGVAREAAILECLWSGGGPPLLEHLPRPLYYDEQLVLLVLDYRRDARTLVEHFVRVGRFGRQLGRALGLALAHLHRTRGADRWSALTLPAPSVLSIHRPPLTAYREASAASIEFFKLIQAHHRIGQRLDELRAGWRVECLVHGDIKGDNVLVVRPPGGRSGARLTLIDWESAGWGTPAWDVGSVFAAFLSFWLFSIPIGMDRPLDDLVPLARYPLAKMQPAVRSFWEAYVHQTGLTATDVVERLPSMMQYCAARLLQTGYERLQHASRMDGSDIVLAQLASNILERPYEAAVYLFGLSVEQLGTVAA